MIATEMPAAMRPYSIAVAPLSSRRKRLNTDMLLSQGYRQSPADTVARYDGELPRISKREPPDFHGYTRQIRAIVNNRLPGTTHHWCAVPAAVRAKMKKAPTQPGPSTKRWCRLLAGVAEL